MVQVKFLVKVKVKVGLWLWLGCLPFFAIALLSRFLLFLCQVLSSSVQRKNETNCLASNADCQQRKRRKEEANNCVNKNPDVDRQVSIVGSGCIFGSHYL